jgi:hypothetical protein
LTVDRGKKMTADKKEKMTVDSSPLTERRGMTVDGEGKPG